ncbi:MAG TPA: class I SAM-dependent methyltransferase [Candidatus Saccharibacteria bacterium]|nr:class I SAM-dependent methyltransferase [Candidatus Saccharibacteria bacterium]HRQ07070.1 class I SAM-dependent methyltransferase [Candidatus Saccharibacteria bacterium]
MSKNNLFYNAKTSEKRDHFFEHQHTNDGVTEIMLHEIDKIINKHDITSILDLGTGNGYLIAETMRRNYSVIATGYKLIGIDSSLSMLKSARTYSKGLGIKFKQMDNHNLQFKNETFDLIMAKAVSDVSISEIFDKLKTGGWFIYKEYGPGRGMVEITNLLSDKPDNDSAEEKVIQMRSLGFSHTELRKYYIPLERNEEEMQTIIEVMRVLPKGISKTNARKIVKDYFKGEIWKKISSDPYLIIGRK